MVNDVPLLSPWKCAVCSDECRKLGIIGSSMYNIEMSNESGVYGSSVITATKGAPKQWYEVLIYRTLGRLNKPQETIEPLCKTCKDMCEAVSDPPIDALGERRLQVAEYFNRARGQEWEAYIKAKNQGAGGEKVE